MAHIIEISDLSAPELAPYIKKAEKFSRLSLLNHTFCNLFNKINRMVCDTCVM